MMKVKMKEAAS